MTTSSSVDVYGLTVDMVDDWWPHISGYLEKATRRSDEKYDIESIYQKVMSKDMQLWVVMDGNKILAAGVTAVHVYPLKKVCCVSFLGGRDLDLWKHTIAKIEQVAIEWGCDYVEVMGRKGWARVLPEYEETSITLRKKLWQAL